MGWTFRRVRSLGAKFEQSNISPDLLEGFKFKLLSKTQVKFTSCVILLILS